MTHRNYLFMVAVFCMTLAVATNATAGQRVNSLTPKIGNFYYWTDMQIKDYTAVGVGKTFYLAGRGGGDEKTTKASKATADSDRDGVLDSRDECPNTPAGVQVDKVGCPAGMDAKEAFYFKDIYFDFNQSALTSKARGVLESKAAWLRDNPEVAVVIEGHCDERGTTEYNIVLGEKRARRAMDFLTGMGINASRLSTVSYGEDRPLDPGHNEAAWSINRRVNFTSH